MFIQKDVAIVIQGPIRISPTILETAWKGFDIIWSTWVGEHVDTTHPVLYNHPPEQRGRLNLGMQVMSTMAGLHKAHELGYKYALKWRSDMVPTDAPSLFNLFTPDAMNVLYWCTSNGGYYTDYFMFGETESQLHVWDIRDVSAYRFPEQAITERLASHKINCIGGLLTLDNDILWHKQGSMIKLHMYQHSHTFVHRNTE